jgi:hypothetical protein
MHEGSQSFWHGSPSSKNWRSGVSSVRRVNLSKNSQSLAISYKGTKIRQEALYASVEE